MNLGKQLHKLGAAAYSHPWRVITAWVVLLIILGAGAATFMKPASSAISIPGTEAQKAIDRSNELFPESGKGSGRIVFHAKDDTSLDDAKRDIESFTARVESTDGVSSAVSPFTNGDALVDKSGTIGYVAIQFDEEIGSIPASTTDRIIDEANKLRSDTLQVEAGGALIDKTPDEILGIGEVVGVVIALGVLVATLGSLIAAGMPILTAILAVGVSTAGLFSLGQLFTINTTTPVLGIMLGLAVGIDYSLFIISRYRTLLQSGYRNKEAAARALGTAGNAVVFAALTVVIALAALSVVSIPFMTTMGLAGASSIAVAALMAITFMPALLGLAGNRIFAKNARAKVVAAQKRGPKKAQSISHQTFWYKWGEKVTRRPWLVLVVSLVLVGVMALPMRDLTLGLPSDQYSAESSTERRAYELVTEGFGKGYNGPLLLVVEDLPEVSEADEAAVRAEAEAAYDKQVAEATAKQEAYFKQKAATVTTFEEQLALQQEIAAAQTEGAKQQAVAKGQIDETVAEYAKFVQLAAVAERITKIDDVATASPVQVKENGTAGLVQVVPTSAPSDQATTDLIETLREESTQKELTNNNGAVFGVTGATALQNDVNAKLASALPLYLAVVVGLSLLLLVIAFRSILVPLKATLGFLLSVAVMFGAIVAVFQWGWFGVTDAPGPIVSFIPIIAIGILFGLAMDYEFFLVSGMHEAYSRTKDAKRAVVHGFGAGSKVVTAAAVIMISVFAGFISNHDATIQAMGLGLAVGILIDAFVVRMTIVPAVMTLLGKSAWWLPKWLDRILPHVSIEGETETASRK